MTNVAQTSQTVTTEYNGWSNRETWLANLWLTNDHPSYNVLMEAINMQCPVFDKAKWLKDLLEEQLDDEIDEPCLWRDLMQHAFRQIDWVELIKANID